MLNNTTEHAVYAMGDTACVLSSDMTFEITFKGDLIAAE